MDETVIINGEKVVDFQMHRNRDGTMVITYGKPFSILTASHHEILSKVRQQGFDCQLFLADRERYGIIEIWLKNFKNMHTILGILGVPDGCYDVDDEFNRIIIFTEYMKEGKVLPHNMGKYVE